MKYKYTIEFFALKPTEGDAEDEAPKRLYECGETGECTIRDVRRDQMEYLQGFMNEMGSEGWELVQVLFNRNGAVSFWKRAVTDEGNKET